MHIWLGHLDLHVSVGLVKTDKALSVNYQNDG